MKFSRKALELDLNSIWPQKYSMRKVTMTLTLVTCGLLASWCTISYKVNTPSMLIVVKRLKIMLGRSELHLNTSAGNRSIKTAKTWSPRCSLKDQQKEWRWPGCRGTPFVSSHCKIRSFVRTATAGRWDIYSGRMWPVVDPLVMAKIRKREASIQGSFKGEFVCLERR